MAFRDFPEQKAVVSLLQRSLERGRLGHAYLFQGGRIEELEAVARTLAKTLNCETPPGASGNGRAADCCDACLSCRKIDQENHPDVLTLRPESKIRVITIDQIRGLMQTIYLKPVQARYKVAILCGADRLNVQAANAFLKTLEEPPANSILILLSTEPERLLETILSRCLRLNFAGDRGRVGDGASLGWLGQFCEEARSGRQSLLGRYRLLAVLMKKLETLREEVTREQSAQSPLERYDDLEPKLREKFEEELAAAIESEYRRRRVELVTGLQWWLRDVWLETLGLGEGMLAYPEFSQASQEIGRRLRSGDALENLRVVDRLQRILHTNVQEALALEVSLLKLKLDSSS